MLIRLIQKTFDSQFNPTNYIVLQSYSIEYTNDNKANNKHRPVTQKISYQIKLTFQSSFVIDIFFLSKKRHNLLNFPRMHIQIQLLIKKKHKSLIKEHNLI